MPVRVRDASRLVREGRKQLLFRAGDEPVREVQLVDEPAVEHGALDGHVDPADIDIDVGEVARCRRDADRRDEAGRALDRSRCDVRRRDADELLELARIGRIALVEVEPAQDGDIRRRRGTPQQSGGRTLPSAGGYPCCAVQAPWCSTGSR
jgi:hypothetical protein